MSEFNVNDYVWVRLTDKGRALNAARWSALSIPGWKPEPPPEEVDGWSRWQLWDLMSAFGEHIYNGCDVPFETTIRFDAPAPAASPEERMRRAVEEQTRTLMAPAASPTLHHPDCKWSDPPDGPPGFVCAPECAASPTPQEPPPVGAAFWSDATTGDYGGASPTGDAPAFCNKCGWVGVGSAEGMGVAHFDKTGCNYLAIIVSPPAPPAETTNEKEASDG